MKLRNKKTGKVYTACCICFGESLEGLEKTNWKTLKEFCEDWEDCKKAGPLIEDEKIRKAVRAWAEMNDIRFIHMCSRTRKENARIVGQNALGRTFTMDIDNEYEIRVCFKDYKECYTIAELCGEED